MPIPFFGPGKHNFRLVFSEPVSTATVTLDALGQLPLASTEPVNAQRYFTATLDLDAWPTLEDGAHGLTITAQDLAGNNLLLLTPSSTVINPATDLVRTSSGGVQGTGGSDASVGSIIGGSYYLVGAGFSDDF